MHRFNETNNAFSMLIVRYSTCDAYIKCAYARKSIAINYRDDSISRKWLARLILMPDIFPWILRVATIQQLSNCIRKCNGVMASMIIKGRDGRSVSTHARYHQQLLTLMRTPETKFVHAHRTLPSTIVKGEPTTWLLFVVIIEVGIETYLCLKVQ